MARCSRSWPVFVLGLVLLTAAAPQSSNNDPVLNPDLRPEPTPTLGIQRVHDLLSEGFESTTFPPPGWATIHLGAGYQWMRNTAYPRTGAACAVMRRGPAGILQDEWLVSPALDLSTFDAPLFEFYEFATTWSGPNARHYIMVSTTSQTDPAQFTQLVEWTPANHPIPSSDYGAPVTVDLSAYAGQSAVYVALRYLGTYADWWFVDDIRVFEYWAHDVSVTSVTPGGVSYVIGNSFVPQATVTNIGRNAETFDLRVQVSESGTVVYDQVQQVANLQIGAVATRTFPSFTVTNNGQYYEVIATAELPTDVDSANNTKRATNDTYNVPKVPLAQLNTNWGCPPCVPANQALDAYYPSQGNSIALMRVHAWWPSANDPMYLANIPQCSALINMYGADYVPHMWIDGVVDAGSEGPNMVAAIEARKAAKGPLTLALSWNETNKRLRVAVNNINPVPPLCGWQVKTVITEDGVALQGPNGEPIHNQVFRWMYPDLDGVSLPTSPGLNYVWVDCPLNAGWVYNQLRATVFVQDPATRKIYGAATAFLTAITEDLTEVPPHSTALVRLDDAYPNPFNPNTKIRFHLPTAQSARLTIFGADGRRVATLLDGALAAGDHEFIWNGSDDAGRTVASGAYFYRLETDRHSETKRMMLVK